jgi:hypothetical protein
MICLRRSTALALALCLFLASASFAAPRPVRPVDSTQGIALSLWEWFSSTVLSGFFGSSEPAFLEKAGSQMDPNGLSLTGNGDAAQTTDAGSQMDPNG